MGDSFHETWERFQSLLAQLPPHVLPDEYKVSSFQEGLSPHTQLLITNACGGSTADKTAAFVMDVCERLAFMSQQCNFSIRANGRHEVGMGTETAIEVSKLAKQMQSMQATMLSMQSFMTNQGSASHIQGRDGSGDMSFNGEDVIESGKLPNSPNDYLDELLAILDEEEEVHVKEAPKEVDELRSQKVELILERDLLKKEKILLQKKVTETVQEKEAMREDFERKMRVMKGELEGKDNALKIMRVKECDYLVKLDKSEQVIKALTNKPTLLNNTHGCGSPFATSTKKNVPKGKNQPQSKMPSRYAPTRKRESREGSKRQSFVSRNTHLRGRVNNGSPGFEKNMFFVTALRTAETRRPIGGCSRVLRAALHPLYVGWVNNDSPGL
ncbi:hypothetical protein LWI29_035517 [Acer saccharum]|uniref:Uncharacterized protein n=1 Tax=Acer saccharum TaxID=4024 RepID=A0AA39RFU0_ACESA|nr:hypothetical protein LWI29_035517 [Acer saccharum]